jgi:DNA-binding transcriptional ArsR family regulator
VTSLYASRPVDLDAVFGALADATRRGILARLARGAATVNELVGPSGLSQPTVSQHLKVLEMAGLVTRGREARYRPVALDARPLAAAAQWIGDYRRCWEESLDQLEEFVKTIDGKEAP